MDRRVAYMRGSTCVTACSVTARGVAACKSKNEPYWQHTLSFSWCSIHENLGAHVYPVLRANEPDFLMLLQVDSALYLKRMLLTMR